MNTETQNESSSSFNRDIKTAIEEIASDLNMKDYSISKKNVPFTGDNYCGNISNVKLKSQNDEDLNVDLFVKEAQREVSRLGSVHKLYEAEIFSYTDILPAFRMLEEVNNILERDRIIYAKYYKGNKKNFKEFVILNDLTCEGYLMYNKRKPFDFEHISLAVQNLAKIHSHSFVLKDKDPELFTYLKSNVTKDFLYEDYIMPTFEAIGKNAVRSIQDQDNKTILEDIINNGVVILRTCLDSSLSEPFNVICHGDCWTNNMLFKYEDAKVCSTVLIDWQIVRYASPVTDLLTVICSTLDKTMLESHFYGLLDIYHEAMRLHMEKMDCDIDKHFPKAALMEGVKSMLRYGLNLATIVISVGSNDSEQVIRLEEYQENTQMAPISSIASKRINDLLDFFKATDLI